MKKSQLCYRTFAFSLRQTLSYEPVNICFFLCIEYEIFRGPHTLRNGPVRHDGVTRLIKDLEVEEVNMNDDQEVFNNDHNADDDDNDDDLLPGIAY